MYRNVLFSLGIHILTLILTVMLIYLSNNNSIFEFIAGGVSILGYLVLGNLLLRPMNTAFMNALSVSIVSMIGLLIGFYGIIPNPMGFNWMIFLGYNLYSFLFLDSLGISPEPLISFWFFIIPTLFMWIGLQLKTMGADLYKIVLIK